MHILEKSSCCIDEKLKLKFMKTYTPWVTTKSKELICQKNKV